MWLSNRAIFQSASLQGALKVYATSTVNFAPVDIGPAMSTPYYLTGPDALNWTCTFDNAAFKEGAFDEFDQWVGGPYDGLGYCGAVTFKHKTMYDLVDANSLTWAVPNDWQGVSDVERPLIRDPITNPANCEYFMFDGVLKAADTPDQYTSVFTPITIARTKLDANGPLSGYYRLAFTSEYMTFVGLWFDIEYDDPSLVDQWLTLVWSHKLVGDFTNWSPDEKYGPASGDAGIRFMLYNATTGQLIGKTDRQVYDSLAYRTLTVTDPTLVFDSRLEVEQPGVDFELNNNCQDLTGEMLRMASVWYSVGSDVWDPLVVGKKVVGTNLPSVIDGKRAVINMTVTEQDGDYVYGFRPGALAQVTSPVNSNNIGALSHYDINKAPLNDKP
jgi:hypothetical protein